MWNLHRGRLGDAITIAKLLAAPRMNRPELSYELFGSMGLSTQYLNVGYWRDAATFDEAAAALVRLVAERARLRPGARVLDVGFGYGDQDILIYETFGPLDIEGVNITPKQVNAARKKAAERGIDQSLRFTVGSATALASPDATFDAVLAIESAMHFDTREDFFREALRVLKPGGRLVTADMIAAPGQRARTYRELLGILPVGLFWQSPPANFYDRFVYAERLRRAGFVDVDVESIRDAVYPAFPRFLLRRLESPEIIARVHPVVRWVLHRQWCDDGEVARNDYVIAYARKAQ